MLCLLKLARSIQHFTFLPFSAFNNIWSNIGYVSLGVLFILIAYRRHSKYRTLEVINMEMTTEQTKTGVPQHFGIYYTIGRVPR